MLITFTFWNLLIVFNFFPPVPYGGQSAFVGPLYAPTDPSTIPHRVDFGSDFYAR